MKSSARGGVLAALVLLLTAPLILAATKVQKVELSTSTPDSARIVLDLSAAPKHKFFTLTNPDRIVVDLTGAHLASGLRLPQAAGPVVSVRSGVQQGKTRLVIQLTRKLDPEISVSGSRLIIDIGKGRRQSVAAVAAAISPPPEAPVRAAHAPDDSGRDVIVAIDAGHGGKDSGAIGVKNTYEKHVVLAIALALAKLIDAEPGMQAYLTRKDDRYIELPDRIALARKARADIFVSIHADSIERRDVAGSSVYVLSEGRASSEAARRLAAQENLAGGISLSDKGDQLASVLMDVSQGASIGSSMEVAERVLSQLDRVGTVRKSKVQQAGFVVLRLPDIPSILVETAYISNPGEEKKLGNPAHQADIAEAIFNGVREQMRVSPPDGTLFARQRDARRAAPTIVADRIGP